jgi:hypothetical protein
MLHRYASEPAALIAQHIVHIEALLEQGGFGTEVPEDLEAIDDLTSLETVLQAVRRSVGRRCGTPRGAVSTTVTTSACGTRSRPRPVPTSPSSLWVSAPSSAGIA